MDMQMYNLVKEAMKQGKSMEDVVAEVNALAQTAQKELEPKTPIADKWGQTAVSYTIRSDVNGKMGKDSLVSAMMTYFTQSGFNPDVCFDTEQEYRAHVEEILDRGFTTSKTAEDIYALQKKGASESEMMSAVFGSIGKMVREALADAGTGLT